MYGPRLPEMGPGKIHCVLGNIFQVINNRFISVGEIGGLESERWLHGGVLSRYRHHIQSSSWIPEIFRKHQVERSFLSQVLPTNGQQVLSG